MIPKHLLGKYARSSSRTARRALLVFLAVGAALAVGGCPHQPPPTIAKVVPPRATPPKAKVTWQESKSGLGFRLSDAEPEPPEHKSAKATLLDAKSTRELLARLPPMTKVPAVQEFALREKSIPTPRPGETLRTAFPPPLPAPDSGPPAVPGQPLVVERFVPEGDVSIAPQLSVTFSAPMAELTSQDDLSKLASPVQLSPLPPGKWNWLGTQTVVFVPDSERFPMATDYTVTVPEGTTSVAGARITASKTWRFSTPAVAVERAEPDGGGEAQPLDPVLFASFNQRIDPERVLAKTTLREAGARSNIAPIPLRLVTASEMESDRELRALSRSAEPGRWVAVRPVSPLPRATHFTWGFEAGMPSAEGPKTTRSEQRYSFSTYSPIALSSMRCAWSERCVPFAPWVVEFNNRLDESSLDRELVRVEPPLPGMKIETIGDGFVIRGRAKGRTKYTITVLPGLRDTFGQRLEAPVQGTIEVGSAEPMLFAEQNPMVVADPAFPYRLAAFSINHPTLRVRLYRVRPSDWTQYLEFREAWDFDQKLVTPPGKLVFDRRIQTRKAPDELVETSIDLGPALTDGHGNVVAIVEPTTAPKRDRWGGVRREWIRSWVQVTEIGLQAFWDDDTVHAWTSQLSDGSALGNVDLELFGTASRGRTDTTGLGKLGLREASPLLVAIRGGDTSFIPAQNSVRWADSYFAPTPLTREDVWFLFTDRGLYKPGERVQAKGWVRTLRPGKGGDVERRPPGSEQSIQYRVRDAQNAEVATGKTTLDESDGFDLRFSLPKNANLGMGSIDLLTSGGSHLATRQFQIQEFRRPEFEVTSSVSEGPHRVGDHAIASVTAAYYAGGGLPSADVKWTVAATDATYKPPGWSSYQFGKAPRFFSWWRSEEPVPPEEWTARTGVDGTHRLRIDFDALPPYYPRSLALEATVTDVNQQEWTSRASVLVHPASVTTGLRASRRMVRSGETLEFEVIVTDLDGKPVSGRFVELHAARLEWDRVGGDYVEVEADAVTCSVTSTTKPEKCGLPMKSAGEYLVSALATDVHGRKSRTEYRVWVMGEDLPEGPQVPEGSVEIMPDREEYRGGDTARLLVMAPFAPAEGVLTVRRSGITDIRRVSLRETTAVLEVPILASYVPNVTVRLDLVGAEVREGEMGLPDPGLPRRPAMAKGETVLRVPPLDRTLAIDIEPAARTLEPGAKTKVNLDVKDAAGHPVSGARVALVVVDESVLALADYKTPDPLEAFYVERGAGVQDLELRWRVALTKPDAATLETQARVMGQGVTRMNGGGHGGRNKSLAASSAARAPMEIQAARSKPGKPSAVPPPSAKREDKKADDGYGYTFDDEPASAAAGLGSGRPAAPLTVRQNWSALAAFVPALRTDERGRASVKVKLPDNLTRYRVMAVAASGANRFGSAEEAITARLPLMVRASPPRFLNFGDHFRLPVVVQNQTSSPVRANVVVRAANLEFTGAPGLSVVVPANDRVEVDFPAAAVRPGTARFQVGASSSAGTDASEDELPVWTPATTEAFATYGAVDQGAVAQPVRRPSDAVKEWGGLELTTSSTALQGLTDAVIYLATYPFECNEQLSSRVLSIAALRDVLDAFKAEGLPPKEDLIARVKADLEKLASRQHWTGGWDWWRKDRNPVPFVSIHVTHALVVAKAKGFKVSDEMSQRALGYLRQIEGRIPHDYSLSVRQTLIAYALYVRHLVGDRDPARARRLIQQAGGVEKLPLEAIGLIWPVLKSDRASEAELAAIRNLVNNRVTETAGAAHFVTSYGDGSWLLLHSDRRVDGILLQALIADQPQSSVIPKLVKGLLAHRTRGRWVSTQENAFVLLALDRYFATYESVTPDFVARAWLGSGFVGEHRFKGRSNDRQETLVPMSYLAGLAQPATLTLAKDGPGRLYYRLGMQYAPKSLWQSPSDHGFAVSRSYEAVENPSDVRRGKDGVWHVKRGATVRVRVGMVARSRRYHVALVDPLPAGFEPLNPALATSATVPDPPRDPEQKRSTPWWWSSSWYEHQNLRDDRAEAFTSLLWDGVYEYVYNARATTPGTFVVPAPKAEEMYSPETFGRGASDRVIIE